MDLDMQDLSNLKGEGVNPDTDVQKIIKTLQNSHLLHEENRRADGHEHKSLSENQTATSTIEPSTSQEVAASQPNVNSDFIQDPDVNKISTNLDLDALE